MSSSSSELREAADRRVRASMMSTSTSSHKGSGGGGRGFAAAPFGALVLPPPPSSNNAKGGRDKGTVRAIQTVAKLLRDMVSDTNRHTGEDERLFASFRGVMASRVADAQVYVESEGGGDNNDSNNSVYACNARDAYDQGLTPGVLSSLLLKLLHDLDDVLLTTKLHEVGLCTS
jgi:hypothetical protein